MKKFNKKKKYKKWHDKRALKISKQRKKKKIYNADARKVPIYKNHKSEIIKREPVIAPENLCLLSETEDCITFFNEIRNENNINKFGHLCFVQMSIKNVLKFDYSTICILIALIGDLKSKGIYLRGDFPENEDCRNQIIESGLLDVLFNEQGKPFKKSQTSELLFIEKGSKLLTRKDNIRISKSVKSVVKHLTGEEYYCKKLRTILLEICGNSIEWGGTKHRQWLIGIKYDKERVIFTITDVGRGILNTLNKKFRQKLSEIFDSKGDDEILKGAFIKKYGSSSKMVNRNKGLPSIKNGFDDGLLKNLKVLTNNVILHYDNDDDSKVFSKNNEFKGTLYRWIITKESLKAS